MSSYGDIETAIQTALADGTATPFKTVRAYGSQLSDSELGVELEKLASVAPAALVMIAGSEANGGVGSSLEEEVQVMVWCIAAGTSREAALRGLAAGQHTPAIIGLWDLIAYCRTTLHNNPSVGTRNPLRYYGMRRFGMPNAPITIASYAALFHLTEYLPDVPSA